MAKVSLTNSLESDITVAGVDKNGEVVQVTIPGKRQNEEGVFVHGTGIIDGDFLEAQVKRSESLRHHFETGALVRSRTGAAVRSEVDA